MLLAEEAAQKEKADRIELQVPLSQCVPVVQSLGRKYTRNVKTGSRSGDLNRNVKMTLPVICIR